ncbi:DUF3575 domain-containing protein [Bacteroides timonensis]|uniref:DUF3575 domain-containing protein n=1 Tax=Bacteroides timonensis TaxID=1470345 RepID=UPI00293463CE|nr:DUF3575 domain-containing protein [Bacteroides timonensis]
MEKRSINIFNNPHLFSGEIPLENKSGRSTGFCLLYFLFLICSPTLIYAAETTATTDSTSTNLLFFTVLFLLLIMSLLTIITLFIFLCRYKRKLRRSQEYLVRTITENLELRKLVPTSQRPYPFNPPNITPEEFTKIIDTMLKRIMFLSLFLLLLLPLAAQEKGGSEYVFRFVPVKDMFYIPYRQNGTELERLCDTLSVCLPQLRSGRMYVNVSSYAASPTSDLSAQRMAYLRNNRVKAELIRQVGMTEKMFVTDRIIPHGYGPDDLRNVVVVTFPASVEKVAQIAGEEAATRVLAYNKEVFGDPEAERLAAEQARQAEQERLTAERAERERLAAEKARQEQEEAERRAAEQTAKEQAEAARFAAKAEEHKHDNSFSLRANLLHWATLTPDLGMEWRIDRNWSILVNGAWTSWSWDNKNRRYALWKLSPEVRYYISKEKRGYIGAMYHIGEFNYKLGDTGKQGDYQGGGITGGYTLPLNRALSLDFHAAVGYSYADYDKYTVSDGIRVRAGSDTKNYWGINQLGVTLVWKMKN